MFVLGKYNQNKSFFNSKALHKVEKKKGKFFFLNKIKPERDMPHR